MMAVIQSMSDADVVATIEANTQAAFARWAEGLGAAIHREPDLTWFLSGAPFALCNGIVWADLSPQSADRRIGETLSHYRERGVPLCWLVGPSSQPADLGPRLEGHGLVHAEAGPGMAVDLDAFAPPADVPDGLAITVVDDGRALEAWIDTLCLGTELPDEVRAHLYGLIERHGLAAAHGLSRHPAIRLYLGALDGEPVATALLFCAAGVAGLYDVATVPRARRRGIGTALSHAALRGARDLGYRAAVLQSSAPGQGVYRRLGFRQYCTVALNISSSD